MEELDIITPIEGAAIDKVIKAKKYINNNIDIDMKELYTPICEILGINRDRAAEAFIFGLICDFESNAESAKKLEA